MKAKLKAGDIIKLYGMELRVCVTPKDQLSCNECQIHHLCNRDSRPLKKMAIENGVDGCIGLIGRTRHFKILTQGTPRTSRETQPALGTYKRMP